MSSKHINFVNYFIAISFSLYLRFCLWKLCYPNSLLGNCMCGSRMETWTRYLHSNVPTRSVQRAFLPHGFPMQSSLSWVHLTDGLPMYPDGQAHWGLWSLTLHWAFRPQAFGKEQGLTHKPSLQDLSEEQSLLLEHSALTQPSVGCRWYPRGQRQTGLWLVVWQSAFWPQSVALQGSLQLPEMHASLAMQTWSRRHPAVQTPPTQFSPLLQSRGLRHFWRQAPFEHTSPHLQSRETLQDLFQDRRRCVRIFVIGIDNLGFI